VRQVRRLTVAAALTAVVLIGMPQLLARQAAPGAPGSLTYLVAPGGALQLQWTHSTGTVTHYIIEAGASPGTTFLRLPTSSFADGLQYGKMPQLVAAFGAAGVGAGNYYVRIIGVNGTVEGAPSNEILLPVRTGCVAPGAPTNFTQIVRGTQGFLMWNPGNGGAATTYVVRASFTPNDPNPPVQLPLGTPYFTLGIPPGSYFVNVVAVNACGQSAPSNEVVVTAPANTPDTTPNPPPGQRLPQPFVQPIVAALAQEAIARGFMSLSQACPTRAAGPYQDVFHELEARKVQPNAFINYIVDGLRQIDRRFGYNAKPTRSWVPSIIAGDEIAYHFGSDAPEGSPNAYAWDVLFGHCTGVGVIPNNGQDRHAPGYRPFYDEFVRWTSAGRF
jgi:hypothetical protein